MVMIPAETLQMMEQEAKDRAAARSGVYVDALSQIVDWWESLPPNLRQDIEGSGNVPGPIGRAMRLVRR